MKIKALQKLLIPLLLLNYASFLLYAEPIKTAELHGIELSDFLYTQLEEYQFSPQKREFSATGSDSFAYNVSVDFQGNYIDERTQPKTLVYAIPQEVFYTHTKEFVDLLFFTEKSKLPYSVEFIFTALDNRRNELPEYDISLQGTENIALNADSSQESFVVLLNVNENEKKSKIFINGLKKSSPKWLAQEVTKAFEKSKIKFSIPQKFLSLYRAGLLFGDEQMALFFRNDTPCIKIDLNHISNIRVLKKFMLNHDASITQNNELHYTFFSFGFYKSFWISEKANLIALEIFGTLTLLFLVCFTFTGKNRIKSKKDFSKYWLLIPVLLTVSMITLFLSQVLCINIPLIHNSNPVVQFANKLLISLFIFSFIFILQKNIKLVDSPSLYDFFLTIISTINIFLFSIADINLFWTFAIEFFIVYKLKNAQTTLKLILSFLLMTIPFIPYAYIYFQNTSVRDVQLLINAKPGINFLLSLILFPFQIIWLRILMLVQSKKEQISLKQRLIYILYSIGIIFLIIISLTVLTSVFLYKKAHTPITKITYQDIENTNLTIEDSLTNLPQLSAHTIKIKSKINAERYSVVISSNQSAAVFDSLYDYSLSDNSKNTVFKIPDYPPKEITIDFSVEKKINKLLTVTALYKTDKKNEYIRESVSKVLEGDSL